ncbi:uncharacterized protein LOC103951493 isoform X1 [Pyrus x bretschneideri]|uniref:uncharacterized protein LOC103951493 isoform X1 n=1 Tax=Pyrus x bretschneideri TaxID=225117 RepID=UPI00202F3BE3|nr:uncharacterized protein LOC103951493 isoform X1 [Pyrus x bretschneideri]
MWLEIICGLIIYQLYRWFVSSDDDDVLDLETSDSKALFSVGDRLAKLYGGKVYVGLRIPDADTASPQTIDLVLVSEGEAAVVSVKNVSGLVSVNADGSWVCEGYSSNHKAQHLPDPVLETKKRASILESYLEQRGVALPQGYLSCKVILSNPKVCTIQSSNFPSEVVTYDQWVQLKPEPKNMFSGWFKGAFRGGKKEMQESVHQKLDFILSTAPTWDRLELKGSKYVLGEFLEFKGKQEDVQALKNIKRSKIGRLVIQKTSMLGFAPSRLQVLYSPRDYRSEGASASEWMEVNVRSSTEVLFQPENSSRVRKFKLSSIVSMSLSA